MAEGSNSSADSLSSSSFFRRQWEDRTGFWGEKFSFLDNYKRFSNRENPIPSWSDSDVEEFIASDPIHGPSLKAAREGAKFAVVGGAIGAIYTAAFVWKYSRSPHGAVLSFGVGGVFGSTIGQEIASHWLQLYKMDTSAAEVKFVDWWVKKNEGQS
ncbi:hypothetical protein HHK36_009185 [Tetracentron sinense]|uniref:Succinate dehydrogenase subunit 6, mitochondrial n=1 Tax=Tetracentron sinense TaxID=13715 RepID=A0A834ZKP3_TETSI|nr:hypothetical protein HHK36_009185 [Tetracentron sinense]